MKLQAIPAARRRRRANLEGGYFWFIAPAAIVVGAVIVFPWVFTLYMSVNAWKLGGRRHASRR